MLIPRQAVPALAVPTLDHGDYVLQDESPARFSLVVFYRGYHCPVCARYLTELGRLLPEFDARGVSVVAISSDAAPRARKMADKVGMPALRMGYGLPLAVARQWGLYVTEGHGKTSIGIDEPPMFSEPGVFLVRPDHTLYYGAVQTMPFARPQFAELLTSVDFAITRDYPARGEYTGPVSAAAQPEMAA
ncbi:MULTISPECIES: peroxiredoxin-like family protein [Cupriavidus]